MKEIKIQKNIRISRRKKKTQNGVIFSPRSTIRRKSSQVFCFLHVLVYMMSGEEAFDLSKSYLYTAV